MSNKEYLKHCPVTTLCYMDDFIRVKKFLEEEFKKNGYGLIISNPELVYIFPMHKFVDSDWYEPQYRFIISNYVKSYTGEDIIEPIAEWESYLEQMIIYDKTNLDFYEENFKNIYKALRPEGWEPED